MKISLKHQTHAKNITNMLKLSQAAKTLSQVFKKLSSLFTVQHTYDLPYTLKSELGFLKTCDKILAACDNFSIFLIF